MKFTVDRDGFTAAVKWVGQALSPRPDPPVLAGMQVTADTGGQIVLSATSLENAHTAQISADVGEPGHLLLPGLGLARFAAAARNDTVTVTDDPDRTTATVTAGSSQAVFRLLPAGDYPCLPDPGTAETAGRMPARDVRTIVNSVAKLPHRPKGDPWEQAVAVTVDDTTDPPVLRMVSGSAHALGANQTRVPGWARMALTLVPASQLSAAVTDLDGDVSVGLDSGGGMLHLAGPDRAASLQLYDPTMPPVDTLLAKTPPAGFTVDTADTIRATRLASSAGSELVRFDVSPGEVTIGSFRSRKGPVDDCLSDTVTRTDSTDDGTGTGGSGSFAVDTAYLGPVLSAIAALSDTVRIRFDPNADSGLLSFDPDKPDPDTAGGDTGTGGADATADIGDGGDPPWNESGDTETVPDAAGGQNPTLAGTAHYVIQSVRLDQK